MLLSCDVLAYVSVVDRVLLVGILVPSVCKEYNR